MAITIDNNYQINDNLRPGYNTAGAAVSGAVHRGATGDTLSAGTTVTGEIVEKEGDQVTIKLGNDQTISAKMQGNADIEVGTTMTFEVAKGANGQTALRPLYSNLSAGSATLSALRAAGLPVNDTTIAMTDKMMSESMPVNRNALVEMFRSISAHQNASPETVVSMTKLGMPLTETNVIQYENYRNFEHQITNDLQEVTAGVSELFHEAAQNGDTAVINEVLNLIDPESLETVAPDETNATQQTVSQEVSGNPASTVTNVTEAPDSNESAVDSIKNTVDSFIGGIKDMIMSKSDEILQTAPETVNTNLSLTPSEQLGLSADLQNILILAGQSSDIREPLDPSQVMSAVKQLVQDYPPEVARVEETELAAYSEEASEAGDEARLQSAAQTDIDSLTNDSGKDTVPTQVGNDTVPTKTGNDTVPTQAGDPAQPAVAAQAAKGGGQVANPVMPAPEEAQDPAVAVKAQISSKLSELIKSEGFTKLVKDSLTAQMSIKPQDVAKNGKIEELYDRIQKTTARITEMMESLGRSDSSVAKAAGALNDNVNFMNNLNEFVNYVQLPLKMAGEDANGELYVYTRKKDLSNKDGNYSALLHLDMEHLGPMDIYVTMRDHTKVNTTFYLASEKLLDFIEAHIDELTKRLIEKGYDTGVRVTKKDTKISPVSVADEFTKEEPHNDSPVVVSKMRFDVRA